MSFPPPPTDAIDWANVGFKIREGERAPRCPSMPLHVPSSSSIPISPSATTCPRPRPLTTPSQRPHRVPLVQDDRPMVPPQVRRRPAHPHPRHVPRPQLRPASLRGPQGLPRPRRLAPPDLPPGQERNPHAALRRRRLHAPRPRGPLRRRLPRRRGAQRRVRAPARDGRRHVRAPADLRVERPAGAVAAGRVHVLRVCRAHGGLPRGAPRQVPYPRQV